MAHFISLDEIGGLAPLEWDGERVSAQWDRLQSRLQAAAPDGAGLFAEPVWAGPPESATEVSWYTNYVGEPVPYSSLPAEEQGPAAAALRQAIEDLVPLLRNREFGPFLGRCLLVPDLEDVLLVGGRPVLRNWGWVLPGLATDAASLETAWAGGLGRFMPEPWRPWDMASPAPAALRGAASRAATPSIPPAPRIPWWRRPAAALPIMAVLLAGSALGSYLVFARTDPPLDAASKTAEAQMTVRGPTVTERIDTFTKAIAAGLCTPDGAETAPLDAAAAGRLLQRAVGRVIVPGPGNPHRGVAFLVAKDRLVTTSAALNGTADRPIFIESPGIGATLRPERTDTPSRAGLTTLRLPVPAQFGVPLHPAASLVPATPVYAGAMPGFINPRDSSFGDILNSGLIESPALVVSRTELPETPDPAPTVGPAALPPGGEGGPVIDACGRLAGIAARTVVKLADAGDLLGGANASPCLVLPSFVTASEPAK